MTIELRLTDVDPPTEEPKRTIYRDIANLPDPTKIGITVRYFNYDDVGLYMQITGSATGYTFTPVNLGLLATGTNAYKNLDEFASRAKPTVAQLPNGEMGESITLTLKAYTDAGYTSLKWTFDRVVQVIWINSADAAFTVDELDNFDDGTVQGWVASNISGNDAGYPTLNVVTDYVLSVQYSLKMDSFRTGSAEVKSRLSKSFTTPNKTAVYAIIDFRLSDDKLAVTSYIRNITICKDAIILVYLGKPFVSEGVRCLPIDRWMRVVVPLPKSTTLEFRFDRDDDNYGIRHSYLWLDDFKIISK